MSELYRASEQWRKRPADERYGSLEAAKNAALQMYVRSFTKEDVEFKDLQITTDPDRKELFLYDGEQKFRLSNAAARNLSNTLQVPYSYINRIPTDLALLNLFNGIQTAEARGSKTQLYYMAHSSDDLLLRDISTMKYKRVYHHEVLDYLINLRDQFGLKTPPARSPQLDPGEVAKMGGELIATRVATEADVIQGMQGGIQVKVGDVISDAGIYLGQGNPELFVFLISPQQIKDGTDAGLFRGVMISTAETMGTAYQADYFLFRGVCGNHIIWGAKDFSSVRLKHVGAVRERVGDSFENKIHGFLNASPQQEEQKILEAKSKLLGDKLEVVLDVLYSADIASKKAITSAYQLAEQYDGDTVNPNSVWGMVQGFTRLSQTLPYGDARVGMDKVASKILSKGWN